MMSVADSRENHVRMALTWLGGLALLPATPETAVRPPVLARNPGPGPGLRVIGWAARPACRRLRQQKVLHGRPLLLPDDRHELFDHNGRHLGGKKPPLVWH